MKPFKNGYVFTYCNLSVSGIQCKVIQGKSIQYADGVHFNRNKSQEIYIIY